RRRCRLPLRLRRACVLRDRDPGARRANRDPVAMRDMHSDFVAVGLDHSTARIEGRGRLAFADAQIPDALQRLTDPARGLLDQAAILSTCNRVELYGVSRSRRADQELATFLARYHGLEMSQIAGMLHVYRGDRVAHHLAATAAGMHSLV